ncbi:MAG: hypothetical protein DYH15_08880 [Nitrosomonas sp. PRO4]|nr:hypothetical protein [Nitrosomonas sp. PRO4]
MHDSIYSFENEGRRKFINRESEDAALEEFAHRLEFTASDFREHRDVLLNFILNHHKLIFRYDELQNRETKWRYIFIFISLMLLCVIPGVIFIISTNNSNYLAQATAILTGLLAVHKSLSSWLDKRKIIGNFWKAKSDLKTKLYAFEDKWKGQATQTVTENEIVKNKLKNDFLQEARSAIIEARAIVQDEQSKFFDAVTYPSIDLVEVLKDAGSNAKTLVSAHQSPELEQRVKQRQIMEKIASLEAEIEQRQNLINNKYQILRSASQDEANALTIEVTNHQGKKRQAEDELIITKGQLEAMRRNKII